MKHKTAGLICAGGVSQSFLARLPSVLAAVGPVFSSSLRVARRMANSLRAGHAVDDLAAFAHCTAIWIVLPEAMLGRIFARLHGVSLTGKTMIVCDTRRVSESIPVTGAHVATLQAADPGERFFAAEGHPAALRILRSALAREKRKLIELHPSAKPLFLAGTDLTSGLLLPCFGAGVESLRKAGFTRREATSVAAVLGTEALRAYLKAGRRAWKPATAEVLRGVRKTDPHVADPHIADVYHTAIEQALRYFAR